MSSTDNGLIESCRHQGCGYLCCEFAAGNFIALYPGELEHARSCGYSVDHLECTPDGWGGHKAICRACDTASCDGGYKPLDCRSYPLFPTVEEKTVSIQTGLKGEKCPLLEIHLAEHGKWVVEEWTSLSRTIPTLRVWLKQMRLVDYIPWKIHSTQHEKNLF